MPGFLKLFSKKCMCMHVFLYILLYIKSNLLVKKAKPRKYKFLIEKGDIKIRIRKFCYLGIKYKAVSHLTIGKRRCMGLIRIDITK